MNRFDRRKEFLSDYGIYSHIFVKHIYFTNIKDVEFIASSKWHFVERI